MARLLDDINKHMKLVTAVGTTTALGTIVLHRFIRYCTSSAGKRKHVGSGPNGKGKWKLYHAHTFMSARCVWLLEEMNVINDFEIIEHNPHTASLQEKYSYKKTVHPHGTIPAMVTSEGDIMLESAAICLYLAKLYGHCLPDERNESVYYNWSVYGATTVDSSVRTVYRQLYTTDEKDRDPSALETNTIRCLEWAGRLESLLSDGDRKFICTNGFTAADVIVGYSVFWLSLINGGIFLRDSPHVQQYLSRLKARPLWKKCMENLDGTDPEWVAITRIN